MMLKVVVIDDEQGARKAITGIIQKYCKEVQVVGEADGVQSGIEAIAQHQPDLVLLDIQMKDGTGFDLLNRVGKVNFKLVFITAYEAYAIKAFKYSALDYILKPAGIDDLVTTLQHVKASIQVEELQRKIDVLINNYEHEVDRKIVLKTTDAMHVVKVKDIIRCEAEGNYTSFYFVEGKRLMVSGILKDYEELLDSEQFFRPHQSHLINVNHLQRFEKRDGGFVIMNGGHEVPVSFRKKEHLLKVIQKI